MRAQALTRPSSDAARIRFAALLHLAPESRHTPIGHVREVLRANQLEAQLIGVKALRVERTPNPDSLNLYFQGTAWLNKGINPQRVTPASKLAVCQRPCNWREEIAPHRLRASVGLLHRAAPFLLCAWQLLRA